MCNTCRQNNISPEIEAILHKEYEKGFYPEMEWSSPGSAAKKYTSPLFNWLSGPTSRQQGAFTKAKPKYPKPPARYNQPQTETGLLKNAIANGERNENALTDLIFFKRHPELGGKPLSSSMANFSTLSREWISMRDSIVRPALQTPSSPVMTKPVPSPGGGTGKISLQTILNALARKNYTVFTKPYQLNIVGVRANTAQPNTFDDTINVFYKDNTGNWQFKSNPATTDPGTFWLENPMQVSGTAIVVPGQYINAYKIGYHHADDPVKRYIALVQQGPINITRDYNKDNKLDFKTGKVETGTYGINIHKAGSSSTQVDSWSAGCQVFARSTDFDAFISLCQQQSNMYGNNFTYTLLEEGDL